MGVCHSAPAVAGVNKGNGVKQRLGENFGGRVEPCPTVFELERAIARRRQASRTVHANLVNIEFRRGFFEVYAKGEDLSPTAYTAIHAEDKRKAFVGIHKRTGRSYAVREVPLPSSRSAPEVEEIWRVFDAWAALDHPNLARLKEIFYTEGGYFVVSGLCSGGDIMSRLADQGRDSYEEPEAVDIVRRIVRALRYCHSMSVVHGNLRIESCLFEDSDPWADMCIVDPCVRPHSFARRGLGVSSNDSIASTVLGSDTSSSTSSTRRKSTGWYMPPELRGGGGGDVCSKAGDMWTLGALTWQMLAGPLTQRGMTQEAAWSCIIVGRPASKGKGWADRSPEAADFVSRLLKSLVNPEDWCASVHLRPEQKDSSKRMTAEEAVKHPWLRRQSPLEDDLCSNIRSSLLAFKESSVVRRLGLMLVGRTLEPASLPPVKSAFHAVDADGKGYIVEEDFAKALMEEPSLSYRSKLDSNDGWREDNAALVSRILSSNHKGDDDAAAEVAVRLAREVFQAIDLERSGRVGFSAFLGACLAEQAVDDPGVRMAFDWLAKNKVVVHAGDVSLLAGKVLSQREVEDAFNDSRSALGAMAINPAALSNRTEAHKSFATSGTSVDGFTYAEFYRLIAGGSPLTSTPTAAHAPVMLISLVTPLSPKPTMLPPL